MGSCYWVEAWDYRRGWVEVSKPVADEETARHLAMLFMCDLPGAVAIVRSGPTAGRTLYAFRDSSR